MVRGGLDIVQPDLARCGGFSQGRRIAQAAFELGRECVPHAFSTGILIAASLQLVAAMPRGTYCEYTVAESHDALDVLASGFEFADGFVRVPIGPRPRHRDRRAEARPPPRRLKSGPPGKTANPSGRVRRLILPLGHAPGDRQPDAVGAPRGAVEVALAGGRDEVVAGLELVLALGQAEAPAALEQQEMLPARVAVPVRDRPAREVDARDVGAVVRLAGASISSSTRPVKRPP